MNTFLTRAAVGAVLAIAPLAAGAALAAPTAADKPPAKFVKVADALKNPGMAFIPGLGELWVDPATLPAGPFLGYDKQGRLVNVTYMLPMKDFDKNKAWNGLGAAVAGKAVDHTDVHVSGAHPGVMERHVHVINWLVPHAEEVSRMGTYPHMH
jgi:hypothetical protein